MFAFFVIFTKTKTTGTRDEKRATKKNIIMNKIISVVTRRGFSSAATSIPVPTTTGAVKRIVLPLSPQMPQMMTGGVGSKKLKTLAVLYGVVLVSTAVGSTYMLCARSKNYIDPLNREDDFRQLKRKAKNHIATTSEALQSDMAAAIEDVLS
jgi:hypothetical protein